jgi:hypothetical protein
MSIDSLSCAPADNDTDLLDCHPDAIKDGTPGALGYLRYVRSFRAYVLSSHFGLETPHLPPKPRLTQVNTLFSQTTGMQGFGLTTTCLAANSTWGVRR